MNTDLVREKNILVVDDNPANLSFIHDLLRPHYKVYLANSGRRALEILERGKPIDLLLLDVMMPDLDGYQVCSRIKAQPCFADLPIIFVTAQTREEEEAQGLALGAVDFISKPVSPQLLLVRVGNYLRFADASQQLRRQNVLLEQRVEQRTRELQVRNAELGAVKEATIVAFCSLAEARDNETGNHILRTQAYLRVLMEELRDHPGYGQGLDDESVEVLVKSASLHDIGKVGIPDHILLKPGKLTAEEFEVMKTHTTLGRDAILKAEEQMVAGSSFLRYAREIAYSHHERWDGQGYPQGLAGEGIPFAARLMAVADVYDALISRRPYKTAKSHEESAAIIVGLSGQHLDPVVVAAFEKHGERFRAIARGFQDIN